VKKSKTPDQRLAGTETSQNARFARILDAAGDDPETLILMISMMERIAFETRSRRRRRAVR
jgi:hypothetical protein